MAWTCPVCGNDKYRGAVWLEFGRRVCWPCYDRVKHSPRLGMVRLRYWLAVLRKPREIKDADLLD